MKLKYRSRCEAERHPPRPQATDNFDNNPGSIEKNYAYTVTHKKRVHRITMGDPHRLLHDQWWTRQQAPQSQPKTVGYHYV
ncbi:MAG: hypothetical protein ACI89D_000689 [Bermanella sp.]|jgi:hypothetical protein